MWKDPPKYTHFQAWPLRNISKVRHTGHGLTDEWFLYSGQESRTTYAFRLPHQARKVKTRIIESTTCIFLKKEFLYQEDSSARVWLFVWIHKVAAPATLILKVLCYLLSLCFSHVWLSATPGTIACQAPLSMGFSRQENWSGLPFPPPRHLPNPGVEPASHLSPALAGGFLTTSTTWETLSGA